jgi:hypothetical protein
MTGLSSSDSVVPWSASSRASHFTASATSAAFGPMLTSTGSEKSDELANTSARGAGASAGAMPVTPANVESRGAESAAGVRGTFPIDGGASARPGPMSSAATRL